MITPEEHQALSLAVNFWFDERTAELPEPPNPATPEQYENFTAAIVIYAIVRHELYKHLDEEYEDPELVNILVGYDRPDMERVTVEKAQKALDLVEERYVHSLSRVGNGGLLHAITMDATRRALKSYLDTA